MKRLAHYSQYFLRNPKLIKELIGHTTLHKSDTVYDIGAGSGLLSSVLSSRCTRVVAVEYEPRVAQTLRTNMREFDNVEVIEGNFLDMQLPAGNYKIFSNIPFHLSSPIVRKITEAVNPPQAAYLIVQKQFANKLLPEFDGFSNQLGMIMGPRFAVRVRRKLLKTDFWPHPNVDTVMIEILRRPEPLIAAKDLAKYQAFIEKCFSSPETFHKLALAPLGFTPTTKPSKLRLAHWVQLFNQTK